MHLRQCLVLLILAMPSFCAALGAVSPPKAPGDQRAAAAQITIQAVKYENKPLEEVIRDLQWKSSGKLGRPDALLNVILALRGNHMPVITFRAEGRTLWELLAKAADLAGCELQQEPHALIVREKGAPPFPPIRAGSGVDLEQARKTLDKIVFPRADFREVPVEESPEFLMHWIKKLDPKGEVRSIIVKKEPGAVRSRPFTFEVRQIPLLDLARYVAGVSGMTVTVEKTELVFAP